MSEKIKLDAKAQTLFNETAARNDWSQERVDAAEKVLMDKYGLTATGIKEELQDTGASELSANHKSALDALSNAAIAETAARNDWSQERVDEVMNRANTDKS